MPKKQAKKRTPSLKKGKKLEATKSLSLAVKGNNGVHASGGNINVT